MASSMEVGADCVTSIRINDATSSQMDTLVATTQSAHGDASYDCTPERPDAIRDPGVMIEEPEASTITHEQRVAKVRRIHAALIEAENECTEEVRKANSSTQALNNEQWEELTKLHRTLLEKIATFSWLRSILQPTKLFGGLRASKQPQCASSREHMSRFISLANSTMESMREIAPAFDNTWVECLGGLARHRIPIEDNPEDREMCLSVSRHWYSKASDKAPTKGILYHHLATLARPNAMQQLFYYAKSLCVSIPFVDGRESIMELFGPYLNGTPTRLQEIDTAFVRAHVVLFSGESSDLFAPSVKEFVDNLDGHIAKQGSGSDTKGWLEKSQYIAIALGCALLEYGSESNVIMMAIKKSRTEEAESAKEDADWDIVDRETSALISKFSHALDFAVRTHEVVFRRFKDPNVNPYLHVTLSFLYHMSHFPTAMGYIEEKMPWKLISLMLNERLKSCLSEDFPRPNEETPRPLPEDFAQRGLFWVDRYYPEDWFSPKRDGDEECIESTSMDEDRQKRCLWLGHHLASSGTWLTYDKSTRQFGVPPQYDVEIPGLEADAPTQLEPGPRTNLENSAHAAAVK